jgi:hypothetical protein
MLSLSEALVGLAHAEPDAAVRHSVDYLEALSITLVGWMWLLSSAVATERLRKGIGEREHAEGKLCAADYWFRTELPRVFTLSALCRQNDDSYARMKPEWF